MPAEYYEVGNQIQTGMS